MLRLEDEETRVRLAVVKTLAKLEFNELRQLATQLSLRFNDESRAVRAAALLVRPLSDEWSDG